MLRIILIAAGVASGTWAGKSIHPWVHTRTHALVPVAMHVRVETGILAAAPFLIIALLLEIHVQRKSKADAPVSQRPSYSFSLPGRRG